ncbi:hypothetical protein LB465_02795 [Salegentibacter sp. LM13S]|uniref:hypothetical protein n=1 Tax=Salegentibacter lacus TaxID=2873599 RepID=UPI001CCA7A1E|nr:hypothetical protein [Salegentibacter lacus]MBZ9629693.1 hypothetical protein [Salegentibacter lacus]
MKKLTNNFSLILIFFSTIIIHSQENKVQKNLISTEKYNLYKPDSSEAVILLFGGFPESAADIENAFPITDYATNENIAVAYLNFNRKIWLKEEEKVQLANDIQEMITVNNLPSDKIYIGGMSSGGSIALLIGNFLSQNSDYDLDPLGIFAIDSPVDLAALYRISEQNIKNNFSQEAVGESSFMLQYFNAQLGNPDKEIAPYEQYSTFTYETQNFQNLKDLKNTKIRFYTEPDKDWWKENMGINYEQMNAFHLKRLSDFLISEDYNNVELITTEGKGYREDGTRNPHSWSIVDKEELIQWVLK